MAKDIMYHIITNDGVGEFNFLTTAQNSKKALKRMQKVSLDFNNIVRGENDLVIIVKRMK